MEKKLLKWKIVVYYIIIKWFYYFLSKQRRKDKQLVWSMDVEALVFGKKEQF